MRHVRFRDPGGRVRRGEWTGDDGAEITAHPTHGARITLESESFAADEVELLPPCEPSKIVCIGRNYADHAEEMGSDIPERPLLFLKPPNTVAAHNQDVELLPGKERIDHEAELGVVIAERCRNVSEAEAEEVIAGYTCVNDISNRDDQRREQNWVRGKAFDNSAPIGPVIATPEEVPSDASIELRLNGETKQSSSRDHFIFSIPELIAEITAYMTLEPGDVISTGTPAGVGPLSDGDEVEVEIEGVGTLRHTVSIP
ncbi:fumarylacetoacetate hydrolase family protein [Natronomonas sp. EA1]|uniref:fumarylacetoacetate hydrolase family protein n=1 Tax=Natronomonas sp. EA1 TaxID=3421655 RepID=UPI003EB8C8F1